MTSYIRNCRGCKKSYPLPHWDIGKVQIAQCDTCDSRQRFDLFTAESHHSRLDLDATEARWAEGFNPITADPEDYRANYGSEKPPGKEWRF